MLALTRKAGESIIIGDNIEITIVEIKGDQVKIGIQAPKEVRILRKEIFSEVRLENKKAAGVANGLAGNKLKDLEKLINKIKPD